MHKYEDDIDEFDEYDEEGGEEQEEEEGAEYEQEEDRQPTQEELEYLELRQRLKESIRRKMKREGGAAYMNSQEKKRKLPYDDFGSFFGPSRPVISSRVIQESKSLLENHQLASRVLNSSHTNKKTVSSRSAGSKNGSYVKQPKVVNELKRKVEKLKDTRDYSFLFSDDAELPAPSKEPASRSTLFPISEARSAQLPAKPKQPSGVNGRHAHCGREEKKPASMISQMHSKPGSSGNQMLSKQGSLGSQMHSRPGSSIRGQMYSRPSTSNSQVSSKLIIHKPASVRKPDSIPVDSRKQIGNNNGIGPGRPMGIGKALRPNKIPVTSLEKKSSVSATKNPLPSVQRPSSSKAQSSDMGQRVEQRKVYHESSRSQMIPKLSAAPSKPQIKKPLKQAPSRGVIDDGRPKKKPVKMSEDDLALSMIRNMFKTDRYAGRGSDDDDSDMEANFDDIMREEKRSARIARKEDEEQLRLIEEEERQERMRKLAKKRKLSHQHY